MILHFRNQEAPFTYKKSILSIDTERELYSFKAVEDMFDYQSYIGVSRDDFNLMLGEIAFNGWDYTEEVI